MLVGVGLLLLQSPGIQTSLAQKAIETAERNLDAKISFSAIKFSPFTTLVLKDLLIKDTSESHHIDTLISAEHISATFTLKGLLAIKDGNMEIERVRLRGAKINFVIYDPKKTGYDTNFSAVFKSKSKGDEYSDMADLFNIKRLKADDVTYRQLDLKDNPDYTPDKDAINWLDYTMSGDLSGHDIRCKGGVFAFELDKSLITAAKGYKARLSGHFESGKGIIKITNTRLVDDWTDLFIKSYTMSSEKPSDYNDFMNKVKLGIDITASPLSLKSVFYYSSIFKNSPIVLDINRLNLAGSLNNFIVNYADILDKKSGIKADISARCADIFDFTKTEIGFESRGIEFSTNGLKTMLTELAPELKIDFDSFPQNLQATILGNINGKLDSLNTDLLLTSNIGNIKLKSAINDLISDPAGFSYDGEAAASGLDLGQVGLGEQFGKSSFIIKSRGRTHDGEADIDVEQLRINRLTFNGYSYGKIDGNGYYRDNTFTGNIRSNDPNLHFIFGGSISNSDKSENSIYKFNLALGYADLTAINIDKRQGKSILSGLLSINLRNTDENILIGDASINNLTYTNDDGKHNIGDIMFASVLDQKIIRINLRSNFADATYVGDPNLSTLISPILACSAARSLPSLFNKEYSWDGRNFDANFNIKDMSEALSFLDADIRISKGTQLSASLKTDSELSLLCRSQEIRINNSVLNGLDLKAHGRYDSGIDLDAEVNELALNGFRAKNAHLYAEAHNDLASGQFVMEEIAGKDILTQLNVNALFSRSDDKNIQIDANLKNSHIINGTHKWEFSDSNITLNDNGVSINGFSIKNGNQALRISGAISSKNKSELIAKLENLDLSTTELQIGPDDKISGIVNGHLAFNTPSNSNAGLNVELDCTNLKIGEVSADNIYASAFLDDEDDLLKFSLSNGPDKNSFKLKAEGSYNPLSKYLNAKLSLNDFNPRIAQPTIKDICYTLDGRLNGKATASGPLDKLNFKSSGIDLDDVKVGLSPTGVFYTLNGKLRYDADGLLIDGIDITDKSQGKASLYGRLDDLTLELNRLTVLDKPSGDYYGNLAIDGKLNLYGKDFSNLVLNANLANSGSGKINVLLANTNENSGSILQFKTPQTEEPVDSPDKFARKKEELANKGDKFEIKCILNVNPDLEINAILDKEGSNSLNITGDGLITADVNTSSSTVSLGGNYSITEGKYHFSTLSSLISKDFNINDGSSLTFAGDIMDTELNISATHSLKTSLGPLISDTTSVSTRRLVNCGISISDKLKSPGVAFSIDIPDLDPTTKNQVESELNTDDKISRQFFSLVVLGGFLPATQSGIVNTSTNNSNFLLTNLSSIMSGQLNSLLQKFDIPLDFGLSYQQNEMGNNVMDLAVSTQLFDNMVSVNGSVGNRKFSSTSDENVVGDLDINIKLNKSGHFRLNVFSHSADDYTNYLDNSQRNGLGISYQKEYDNLLTFIKSLFRKKEDEEIREVPANKTFTIKNE